MDISPIVSLEGISKSFGKVQANKNISLSFRTGIIKALLGENGAGKSTLLSILAGRLQPDSGQIILDGRPVQFSSPKDAFTAGIGMVYQHFMLVDSMTVAENVMLGQQDSLILSPLAMQEAVGKLAGKYAMSLDPAAPVGKLSMGERQRVEILKLLRRDCRLLIFDEPTAVLTPVETEQLFRSFRQMVMRGKSLVFISHKLNEVLEIADEIDLLRLGELVDSFDIDHVPDKRTLAHRMIGKDVDLAFEKLPSKIEEVVLEAENIETMVGSTVSFSLKRGEVLAIVGVAGNGQQRLVSVLAGLSPPVSGSVTLLGKDWDSFYLGTQKTGGVVYIPEDRQGLATCPNLSLIENVLLTARELFSTSMGLSRRLAREATIKLIKEYDVRPADPDATARSLSGGNLQKLVIGRELLRSPSIVIAENPTQGLDVTATRDVWQKLLEARTHAGVLLVTGDTAEALQLADKIAVMYRGRFVSSFSVTNEKMVFQMGAMMAGIIQNQDTTSKVDAAS